MLHDRFSRGLIYAMNVIMLAALGADGQVAGPSADGQVLLEEKFVDAEESLGRWEFQGDPDATLTFVPTDEAGQAAYVDYRERAAWRLLARKTIALEAGEQYTLTARVRRNLGYGQTRMVAQTAGTDATEIIAEAEVIRRDNVFHDLSVVFRAAADTTVRVGFLANGYAELWIESIRLQHNVPPISSYATGILLPAHSPTRQARFRTGVFLEAEDLVADAGQVSPEDVDGDCLWSACQLDPASNPWLFSENTVIKSDSASIEEGGNVPPLELRATGLLPGPCEVILSDPQRDAAVSLDGETWRRVRGAAGEVNLGLVDVTGELSVWVAHRFRTEANPGPIYVDYLRLMPVYDAAGGLEKPTPPAQTGAPAEVQRTTLRLHQTQGIGRQQEWITAGIPFARGEFQPGDGVRVAGASDLAPRPLVLWPDGSVKWLRVWFRASAAADGGELAVEYGRGVEPPDAPRPTDTTDAETVRCGEVEVTVRDGVWDRLTLAGRSVFSEAPSVRLRTASGLRLERLRVEAVSLADDGLRPGVKVKGHLAGADGTAAPYAFEAVLTETAPETLGLRFWVMNESDEAYEPEKGCGPAAPLTEFALVLNGVQVSPESVQWPTTVVPRDGRAQTLLQGGVGDSVADFEGEWTLRRGDDVVASGDQTDGWLDLRGAGAGLAIGVREFLEKCPSGLTVRESADGLAIDVAAWPWEVGRVLRFAQGTRLTVEVALVPHGGELSTSIRDARLASVLDPLCATLPPAHYCRSGVFGPVTASRDGRFRAYHDGASRIMQVLRAQRMRYGIEDWGDYFDRCGYVRTESKLWTNLEWNFVACLVVEFARTGEMEFLRAARQAARHFVDADVAHSSTTPAWVGGSYVHTGDTREGHQVDPPDFAHAGWPEGLLWLYYMEGDERLRETAVGLADYVVRNMPREGPYESSPPFSMWNCDRQAGNPILTLASVYDLTRAPNYLAVLNRLVDYALRVQDPKLGCWSVPKYEEPAFHYPSPAWGAVLPRGLHLYWEMTGDERVARAFRRLGAFYLERHPTETRHYLKPGSYYRTNFFFVSEACAFAALFASEPELLVGKALEPLGAAFAEKAPEALEARGVPGLLSGGSRLEAVAADLPPPGRPARDP